MEPNIYVAFDHPTCVHVTVTHARSARSAVQLARSFASKHYGMPVGSYVSSSGRGYPDGSADYTYVFDAPDLVAYREVWEVHHIVRGRTVAVIVWPTEAEARESAEACPAADALAGRSVSVRGRVTEYRRPRDICAECGVDRRSYVHAGYYLDGHEFVAPST